MTNYKTTAKNKIVSIVLLIVFSCQSQQDSLIKNEDYLLDSDFFRTEKFIPLETTNSSLISRVSKILMHKNNIFILDKIQGKLFIFDSDGKFRTSLESSGSGPDQMRIFTDFVIDYKNENLRIFSNVERKELVIDFNGNVLKKNNLNDFFWEEIAIQNENYLVFKTELGGTGEKVGLSYIDNKNSLNPLIVHEGGIEPVNVSNYPSLTNSTRGVGYLVPPTSMNRNFELAFHDTKKNSSTSLFSDEVNDFQVVISPVVTKDFQTIMKAPGPGSQNNSLSQFEIIYGLRGEFRKGNYAVNDLYNHHHEIRAINELNQIVSIHYMEQVFNDQANNFNNEIAFKSNGIEGSKDKKATKQFEKLIHSQGPEGNPIVALFSIK